MSTIKQVFAKTSVAGFVSLLFALTACFLAVTDRLTVEGFLGLAALPMAWLYKQTSRS